MASMSNLREELSKLQAAFKGGPNNTRVDVNFETDPQSMRCVGAMIRINTHARDSAAFQGLDQTITITGTRGGEDE